MCIYYLGTFSLGDKPLACQVMLKDSKGYPISDGGQTHVYSNIEARMRVRDPVYIVAAPGTSSFIEEPLTKSEQSSARHTAMHVL